MNKTTKNLNLLKIGAVLVLAFAWAMIPFALNDSVVQADVDSDIRIRASLTGAAINGVTPSGFAEHRNDPDDGRRRLNVQAFTVNLPSGTTLGIYVNNALVEQIAVNNGSGFFDIDTNNGQSVPNASNGTPIAVRQGTTDILSGTFGIFSPSPSPSVSPSVSPSGSPNPSPSVSPTASPNPSPSVSPTVNPSPTVSPSPTGSPSPSPSPNGGDLFAVLSGATVNGVLPNGFAQYEIHSSRRELEIEVNQVNLPAGTLLGVTVDNTAVGQLFIESDGRGRLRLRTDNGQFVPVVVSGSTIVLRNGGTAILSGVFGGASPSPSPSPSVSPTVSPSPIGSPSPSPSPSASPTPTLGRYFEAQATGSQMIPPVSTGATSKIKVLLNQAETEAIITGQFNNLSSAQTTAKIFSTAGDTNLVHEFAVVGGTNGNFVSAAIPVNALQVAQLRTGLWFSVIGSANNPNGEVGGRLRTQSVSSDFDGDGRQDFAVYRPTAGTWYAQNSNGFSAQVFGGANDKLVSGDYDGDGRTDAAVFRNENGIGVWDVKRSSDGGLTTRAFGYATDTAQRGDFDGDGRQDFSVYRPGAGTWYAQNSNGFSAQVFGSANDKLVSGDYDGDGRTDAAVVRNENGIGVWEVKRSSDGGLTTRAFGFATDTAQRGDFDGDGRQDLAVFRSSNGTWYIQKSSNGSIVGVQFGASEDKAVATDFDGDGKTDIAVFRPSNGTWYWLRSIDGGFSAAAFGQSGDVPIAGDFDGDGKTDLSVFRPSNGVWYIQRSSNGTFDFRQFGFGDDIPVAGNYDGDNKTDIAVFRPSTGIWYIWRSLDGTFDYRHFGQNGDVPTPSR